MRLETKDLMADIRNYKKFKTFLQVLMLGPFESLKASDSRTFMGFLGLFSLSKKTLILILNHLIRNNNTTKEFENDLIC